MSELLRVENLYAGVEEKEIIKGLDLKINKGKVMKKVSNEARI